LEKDRSEIEMWGEPQKWSRDVHVANATVDTETRNVRFAEPQRKREPNKKEIRDIQEI
jgi:hypothetical protein